MDSIFDTPNFNVPPEVRALLNKLSDIDSGKWDRIAKSVELFWGGEEGHEYLNSLMKNDDDKKVRIGFPKEVMTILLALISMHLKFYHPPPSQLTMWNIWD